MTQKEFSKKAIRHGELILKPVDSIPAGAKEIYQGKEYVMAHSETGHHHVLTSPVTSFKVYEKDGETYLETIEVGELIHKKSFDKHETKKVQPGVYKFGPKYAFDYFAKKMIKVQD